MNYILITPMKDEEEHLIRLERTIVSQTIKPLVWVVVNSGSIDNSFQTATKLFKPYDWIYVINQKKFLENGYSHKNFAQAVNEGYKFAYRLCEKKRLVYRYIGKTDATPILAKNYFETLLLEMEKEPKLAITCGIQKLVYNKKTYNADSIHNIPLTGFNDIRLYRKEFFEKIGGYPITFSPDGVLLIKAENRGFGLKVMENTFFIKARIGGSKTGLCRGFKLYGRGMYTLGYHPLLILASSLYNSYKFPPHYQALFIIYGYLLCWVQDTQKVDDDEVIEYFGKKRLHEIFHALVHR